MTEQQQEEDRQQEEDKRVLSERFAIDDLGRSVLADVAEARRKIENDCDEFLIGFMVRCWKDGVFSVGLLTETEVAAGTEGVKVEDLVANNAGGVAAYIVKNLFREWFSSSLYNVRNELEKAIESREQALHTLDAVVRGMLIDYWREESRDP